MACGVSTLLRRCCNWGSFPSASRRDSRCPRFPACSVRMALPICPARHWPPRPMNSNCRSASSRPCADFSSTLLNVPHARILNVRSSGACCASPCGGRQRDQLIAQEAAGCYCFASSSQEKNSFGGGAAVDCTVAVPVSQLKPSARLSAACRAAALAWGNDPAT